MLNDALKLISIAFNIIKIKVNCPKKFNSLFFKLEIFLIILDYNICIEALNIISVSTNR